MTRALTCCVRPLEQVEMGEAAGKNNMVQMAKDSRGQASRDVIDLLLSSQRKSWAPLLFGAARCHPHAPHTL